MLFYMTADKEPSRFLAALERNYVADRGRFIFLR